MNTACSGRPSANGWQREQPDNWLRRPDPWEVARPNEQVEVKLNCSFETRGRQLQPIPGKPSSLIGIPFDRPVVGYGGKTINTLRLWAAAAPDSFDFQEFSHGDFVGAVAETLAAESLTRVLYPDDSTSMGQGLRFVQEYFLVACSLADLVRRFRRGNADWKTLPEKVAIQLNDTHPAMAVPELMRILLDEAHLGWDQAWDLTAADAGLHESHPLARGAGEVAGPLVRDAAAPPPGDHLRDQSPPARLGPATLSRGRRPGRADQPDRGRPPPSTSAWPTWRSSARTAPTASPRFTPSCSARRRSRTWPRCSRSDSATRPTASRRGAGCCWPTPPWPERSPTPSATAGSRTWRNCKSSSPSPTTTAFARRSASAKRQAKAEFAAGSRRRPAKWWTRRRFSIARSSASTSTSGNCSTRCASSCCTTGCGPIPSLEVPPRTFLFGGKAAPAYQLAKLIIKFINNLAGTIDGDPAVRGRIKVLFLPEYCVSLAERLIPASDVSNQISTAGYEASGTSNMKFMMNGALTIGTRDGATIEMAEEAGEENFFLFGLTAEQVAKSRGWYNPHWHYEHEPETRAALDLIFADHFSRNEPGVFAPFATRC